MADVAKAPGACDLNYLLGREWAVQVKAVGAEATAWDFLRGITSVTWTNGVSTSDTTTIDNAGFKTSVKTAIEPKLEVKGLFARAGSDVDLHPSLKLVKKAGEKFGPDGKLDVRFWRTDGVEEGKDGTFSVEFEEDTSDDLRSFTVTFSPTCPPKDIKPVVKGSETAASVPATTV